MRWGAVISTVAAAGVLLSGQPAAAHSSPVVQGDEGAGSVTAAAPMQEHGTQDLDVAAVPPTGGADNKDRRLVTASVSDLAVIGVSWESDRAVAADSEVSVRLRSLERGIWTDWSRLEVESAPSGPDERAGSAPVAVLDASRIEVEVTAPRGALPGDAQVHVVDPGQHAGDLSARSLTPPADDTVAATTPSSSSAVRSTAQADATAVPTNGVPAVLSRAAWGADETLRGWRPELGRVDGAVIHHTAGRNDYTPEDVPAILRGIYRYHAVTLGWGDIGYNLLVDRFGRIWEGRFGGVTHPIVGGHASGVNPTMLGVAVLGDFTTEPAPRSALLAVAQATAWKFARHGTSPEGPAVGADGVALSDRVVGHRDVGATLCPGDALYAQLGELRGLLREAYRTMPTYPQHTPYPVRLSGADRFGTSVASSQWTFPRASVVFVATGFEYADALAGTPAAALTGSPVLLVRPNEVPDAVVAEITRLRPTTIKVLGGASAISGQSLQQLSRLAPNVEVLAGVDRYATGALISAQHWADGGAQTVYAASGQSPPDALAAAAAAAKDGAPLLLVRRDGLPGPTELELRRLMPQRVIVVGGTSVIDRALERELATVVPTAQVERIAGADRYQTSALLVDRQWGRAPLVFHATGATWPDALSASSAAARANAPLLLLRRDCASKPVRASLQRLAPATEHIIGGPSAVADRASARTC